MKNLSIEKRDGIKRKETRQGWMDGWMLPWWNPTNQQAHVLYCHSRPNSLYDNK